MHRAALDRARAGSAPPRPPGRRTRAASAGAGWPSAPATRPGTHRPNRPGRASRRPPVLRRQLVQLDVDALVLGDQIDRVVQRGEHPRPSRSNLTSPAAAQSSLSHCSTVRSSIRAHSTGHTSPTGRSQITMPPEWMPRCRGKPISSVASATDRLGHARIVARALRCAVPHRRSAWTTRPAGPGEYPSALAMSAPPTAAGR